MKLREVTVLICATLVSVPALSGDIIANANVQLSMDEVKDVYLGDKQLAGSIKLAAVDNGAEQAAFLSAVLKMDIQHYQARWQKKSFRDGLSPLPLKGSDAEVMAFVRTTPGAIGYVKAAAAGMKVIGKY